MVKFSKQFEGQLVHEWKEAFLDYRRLKKCIKKINLLDANTTNTPTNHSFLSSLKNFAPFGHPRRDPPRPIQVHKKLASSASKNDVYETEVVEQFADTDAAKQFFSCLDLELNKVNQFYKTKEKEFLDRGDSLKEQIRILIQQREPRDGDDSSISFEDECSRVGTEEDSFIYELERNGEPLTDSPRPERSLKVTETGEEVKKMKISIPLTTPTRKLTAMSYLLRGYSGETKVQINKTKLRHAKKMIKGAFVELYKGLDHLKTYRHLNMLAFIKIMKKFDKAMGKQVLPIYLKVVESSYFNCSDKVLKLADEVEELFTKHFAEDNKRKAVKYLKPRQPRRKGSHVVTFFIGLLTGGFAMLLAGYAIKASDTGMYKQEIDSMYMETIYPVISMFSLLFLHLFVYGCDMFMWQKMRINYSFMFELAPTKELKYRDVFLICATAMTLVAGVMYAHLTLIDKGYSYSHVQAIPGLLVLTFLLILVCPFTIFYRSSRYRFLRTLRNVVLSPLYKVVMLDFFLAEQLCSQVPMLRNLEYIACYYVTGSYKTQNYVNCRTVAHFRDISYAVSFLPYYWRVMQCGRRWFDEGETSHLVNMGKYVSTMLAAGAKLAYQREEKIGFLCLLVVMTSAATIYQLYWDFVEDWGLLRRNSKNPWLRDHLVLRRKFIYYISMGLNLVLRLVWLQTVFHLTFENVDYRLTNLFLAALEVIRRGQGNFYRLENEHMNNVGKFRAVKTVPLPFHEVDDEG